MRPFEIVAGSQETPQRSLRASGELDVASAERLLAAVTAVLVAPGTAGLRLDLGEITFIDSVGVGTLIKIHQIASEVGGLDITGSSTAVQHLIRLTGLAEMFGLEAEPRSQIAGP